VLVRTPDGLGTGFVVGDGSIVATNFHVIAGASEAIAEFADGTKVDFDGYLVASPGYDLAILKLPRPAGQPPLRLQADRLDLGTDVFAIGSPRGLAGSVSKGRALAWALARPRCNLFCGNPVEGVDSSLIVCHVTSLPRSLIIGGH
jgi:S1-C subfamily serine protease